MQYDFKDDRLHLQRTPEEKEPLLQRLNRVEGQVRGLRQMIENDRYCGDEVQQASAITAAIREVALMMKQEDTGVIPVVDYDASGNGKENDTRNYDSRAYSRGKLVGLITDRDIAIRAVSEGKDCTATRAEEIMSTDIHTARPNDRVVDVIRKMGNKQVRRIPVTNETGYLSGMISMADIAVETHEDHELAEAIEEISKGSSFWHRIFG